jgi:hypothetical protein
MLELGERADQAPEFLLRLLADAAGVDDDEVGAFVLVGPTVTAPAQRLLDSLGIVDVHLATESLDGVARHDHWCLRTARE